MNKNAPKTVITLRSRSSIAKVFGRYSKARRDASSSVFAIKKVKMYGEMLVVRGAPFLGRKKRCVVVRSFAPMREVRKYMRRGFRVVVEGYPNTKEIIREEAA